MKSKFTTLLIVLLITAIISGLGFLFFKTFIVTKIVNNDDVKNINIDVSQNQLESGGNNSWKPENQTVIEPNIDNPNDEYIIQTDDFATTYYYSQLNETGKAIYDGLKNNKNNLVSGNYIIDYGTKFNTLLNSEGRRRGIRQSLSSCMGCIYL